MEAGNEVGRRAACGRRAGLSSSRMRLARRVIRLSSICSHDKLKVRRPLEPPIVWQLCAAQLLERGQLQCLRHTIHDRTRSVAVVHAGFNVSLSEGPMAELLESKGLVNSLHGGPLMVLLAQDIDMITMPDEIFIFSGASFDEVRRSHCHEVSRMLLPACDHPCLAFSRSLVPSCCRAAPDTALCPSPDALRLTLPYRLTRLYHLHGRPDDGRRARGATRPCRAATLFHAHGCAWAIDLELHS